METYNIILNNLQNLKDHFYKTYKGVSGKTNTKLYQIRKLVQEKHIEMKTLSFDDSPELLEKVEYLTMMYENIGDVTFEWENEMNVYDDEIQLKFSNDMEELLGILINITDTIQLYSDYYTKQYLKKDKENRKLYEEQGIFLFYTSKDIEEYVTRLRNTSTELLLDIENSLDDFYSELILNEECAVSISYHDIDEINNVISKLKNMDYPEERRKYVFLKLNMKEVKNLKQKYLSNKEQYFKELSETIQQILKDLDSKIVKIQNKDVPTIIKYLVEDVQYLSTYTQSVSEKEIIRELNKYPPKLISQLESEFMFSDFISNKSLYLRILDDLLSKLNVIVRVTDEDISHNLEDIPYKNRVVYLMKRLLTDSDIVGKKVSLIYKEDYVNLIKEFYENNSTEIIQSIVNDIESSKEQLNHFYTEYLSEYKYAKYYNGRVNKIIKHLEELKKEYELLGTPIIITKADDNYNRVFIEAVTSSGRFKFIMHPHYLISSDTMACLYTNDDELFNYQTASLEKVWEHFEVFKQITFSLIEIYDYLD